MNQPSAPTFAPQPTTGSAPWDQAIAGAQKFMLHGMFFLVGVVILGMGLLIMIGPKKIASTAVTVGAAVA